MQPKLRLRQTVTQSFNPPQAIQIIIGTLEKYGRYFKVPNHLRRKAECRSNLASRLQTMCSAHQNIVFTMINVVMSYLQNYGKQFLITTVTVNKN